MTCSKCGNIQEGGEACAKCGNSLSAPVAQPAPSSPTPPVQEPKGKSKKFFAGAGTIVVLIVVGILSRTFSDKLFNKTPSNQELIHNTVLEVKKQATFPYELDQVTTWTGIEETPGALRYEYTLHEINENEITNEAIKADLSNVLCQNAETRKILDLGIKMDYSYKMATSTKTFFVSIAKADCK